MKKFLLTILSILAVALTGYGAVVQVSVDPAPGEVTQVPQTIKVSTDVDVYFFSLGMNKGKITFTDAAGNSYEPTHSLATNSLGKAKEFEVTLNQAYTEPGTYKLWIKGTSLIADDYGEYANAEQTFTWTIAEGGSTEPGLDPNHINLLSVDPAEGKVTELPAEIWVTTDNDLYIGTSNSAQKKFHLTDANGNTYAVTAVAKDQDSNYTFESVRIKLTNGAITDPGTYTLTFDEGALKDNATKTVINLAKSYTWTIEGSSEPEKPTAVNILNVTPAEGTVEELSSILVEVDQPIVMHPMADFSLVDEAGTYYLPTRELVDPDGDGVIKHAKFTFETPITAAGTYTFSMSANALANMEMQIGTPATSYTYTIEEKVEEPSIAITSIEPAEGVVTEIPATIKIVTDSKNLNDITANRVQKWFSLTDDKGNTYAMTGKTTNSYTSVTLTLTNGAITAPGTYTLTLKDEAITEYGNAAMHTNPATFTWTIEETQPAVEYIKVESIKPEVGVVTEISTIGIYTDTDLVSALYSKMSFKDANGTEYAIKESGVTNPNGGPIYNLAYVWLADKITAPGTYTLTVEEGAITEYNGSKVNDKWTFTWTIEEAAPAEPVVTISPAEGETVDALSKVIVTCDQGIAVNGLKYSSVKGMTSTTLFSLYNQVDVNTVELILESEITDGGEYTIEIQPGVFTLNPTGAATTYPEAVWATKVNVSGALATKLEVTPADQSTLETVQHFTVTFAKGIMVKPGYTTEEQPFLGYTDPTTGASEQIELTVGATTETSVTLSTAAEQTKAGYYTLVIPAGFFVLENMYLNEYIMCQYNVTGKEEPGPGSDYVQILSVDPAEGTVTEIPATISLYTDTDLGSVFFSEMSLTDANGNEYGFHSTGSNDSDDNGSYDRAWVKLADMQPITAPGTYTLTVKPGALIEYNGTKTNEEVSFTWTIEGGETPELDPDHINFLSVDPAEGKVTELPAEIWVTTDTDLYIGTSNSAQNKFHLTDANGNTYAVTAVAKDTDSNYSYESVRITLTNGAITAPGTYTLTFDEGAVKKDSDKTFINLAKSFTWTIKDTSAELIQVLSVDPAEGVVEVLPRTIDIFTDTDLVAATVSQMTMIDAAGNEYAVMEASPGDSDQNGSYDRLRISLAQEITTPGTYTLTIPAGTIQEMGGSRTNAELSFTWTVATVEYIEVYSIDPEEGNLGQLPALISIYTNADIISVAESKVSLVDDKGNNHALKITTKDTDYDETAETVEFELVNGAIKTQGTYTLTIEKGAMVDYSDPNLTNNTLVFVWEVEGTGIAGIEAGADGYVVYDLNGYLVMQTRDAADLRRLERGFYIINGKKVVLNK